jgi:hypothetical protein
VDLGPLIGRKLGLKTRERIPFSGGMEMEVEPAAGEVERRGRSGGVNGRSRMEDAASSIAEYFVLGVVDAYTHEPRV